MKKCYDSDQGKHIQTKTVMHASKTPLTCWLIWAIGAGFFFVEYFIRVSPSVIPDELMRTFHIDALALGGLSAFFYYAYISMQIPVGILVDHFHPKRLLGINLLICGAGSLLFAASHNIIICDISRFIMGFSAAFAFVGTLKIVSLYFPARRFALLAGITQGLGMLGACIGQAPISALFHQFGWRLSMVGIAIILFLLAALTCIPTKINRSHKPIQHSVTTLRHQLRQVFTNVQNLYNCLFIGLLYGPTAAFGGLWGTSYLSRIEHCHITAAATATGMMFIGMMIGCPFAGWLSDRLGRRVIVMRYSAIISTLLLCFILYSQPWLHLEFTLTQASLLLFIYGFTNAGLVPSYTLAAEINPREVAGVGLGVTNMASVILGALFIPIIGKVLDTYQTTHQTTGDFSAHDFHIALAVLPISLALAILVSFFIKETYCQPSEQSAAPNHPTASS